LPGFQALACALLLPSLDERPDLSAEFGKRAVFLLYFQQDLGLGQDRQFRRFATARSAASAEAATLNRNQDALRLTLRSVTD
jgi:hypothetical protein